MKQSFRYSLSLLLLIASLPAFAGGGHISFTQSNGGAITATFSFGPCPIGLLPGSGVPPTIALAANRFTITSPPVVASALLPGGLCPAQTIPYSVSASLGNIPDGHYTIIWVYGPAQATAEFEVISGLLQITRPVPMLSYSLLFALALLLIAVAVPSTQLNVN